MNITKPAPILPHEKDAAGNVLEEFKAKSEMTCWECHHNGERFDGPVQPFGRLCWYVDKDAHPMDPQTSPALFVSWRLESGLRYRQTLIVINYDRVRKGGFTAQAMKSVPQKEVFFPSELVFPFAELRKTSINQMKPLSSPADAKLPLSLPWSEQAADAPAAVEDRRGHQV